MFAATWTCQRAADSADCLRFPAPSEAGGSRPCFVFGLELGVIVRTRCLAPLHATSHGCSIAGISLGNLLDENIHVNRTLGMAWLVTYENFASQAADRIQIRALHTRRPGPESLGRDAEPARSECHGLLVWGAEPWTGESLSFRNVV